MGDPEDWQQPSGLLPEGSSFFGVISVANEKWAWAELRIAELIDCIQPTKSSENRRRAVAEYVQQLICKHFDCQVFTFGSVPLKTYLPDGDIDLTAFSKNQHLNETWAGDVRSVFEDEEHRHDAEFRVREVQYIHAEVKIVKCLVENIVVDISFNQLGGLCTLCFLEEVDRLIGQKHLFKRSIILVKAWCYYESRILGAHHGLISTYALETLVLYIFHVFHASLRGPLEVLFRFLDFFSNFDWDKYCVSLRGPVPIATLPDLTPEPPRKDGGELLLNKEFLDACSETYAVFPGGQDGQGRSFTSKHLNVVDPLRTSNNLGRSVSKGNFFRIRSAFGYGARKLARILECPKEKLNTELDCFFRNTWDRHGSRRRPDVLIPVNHAQQSSVLGHVVPNNFVSPKYKKGRTLENHAGLAETNGTCDLSASSLSAEAEVLRSAFQHVSKIIREVNTPGEEFSKVGECALSKSINHEPAHASELPGRQIDEPFQKEDITQVDELYSQRRVRSQRKQNSNMEQVAISSSSKTGGSSDNAENSERPNLRLPLARSTRSDDQIVVTSKVLASTVIDAPTLTASQSIEIPLNPVMQEKTEKECKKETCHFKGPPKTINIHRKNEDSMVGSSATQESQVSLQMQTSVSLSLPHQEDFASPLALGVSNEHTSSSMSVSRGSGSGYGGPSYVTFSLPRGPVPPPLPPYIGFIGVPSPHLVTKSEDAIPLSHQFSSFLPQLDEVLQPHDHTLWPQDEQVHDLHAIHLDSSTPHATHVAVAAALVHSPSQLAVSEVFPSPIAVSPASSFPVSGDLRFVRPVSLNMPTFYLNNHNSFSDIATEIEDTTAGRHIFPLETMEETVSTLAQERIGTGSTSSKMGPSEINVVGKASERPFRKAYDKASTKGKGVSNSNEKICESMRDEDGYVVSYGEDPMYFPAQTSYGNTALSLPGYPHVFSSAGSVSGPIVYPSNAIQQFFPQTSIYSGRSVAADSPVLIPYSPFSSQVASVSSVPARPSVSQLSSPSGVSENGPIKSLRPSGSDQAGAPLNSYRSHRVMESPGASPNTYMHVPYIAMHNSFPVYVLPSNFDGTSGLDTPDHLQLHQNLGALDEFGIEMFEDTQMKLNSQGMYGVGERLLASGVPVSAGSQLQAFSFDGNFEAAIQDSRFDPLSTDFAGHLRNLDYGRICQNPQVLIPVLNQPPIVHPSPKYLQGQFAWEGPGRPLQSTISSGGHGYMPVSSTMLSSGRNSGGYHIISGTSNVSGDEAQRVRFGINTYLSGQRQNFSRDTHTSGRNNPGTHNQYHSERDGGQTFGPRHRNAGRGHTRFEGRSSSHMTNENSSLEEMVSERVRHLSMQDSLGRGHLQGYPGGLSSSVSAVPAGTVLTSTSGMSVEMLPQIYVNNNVVLAAGGANAPPVLVVYPYGNAIEFTSESLEFASVGMLQSAALQTDTEQEGHMIGRSNLTRSTKPAYVTIPPGSMAIPTISNEAYLQPYSPSYQKRSFHPTYQLTEEDFPPLSFGP